MLRLAGPGADQRGQLERAHVVAEVADRLERPLLLARRPLAQPALEQPPGERPARARLGVRAQPGDQRLLGGGLARERRLLQHAQQLGHVLVGEAPLAEHQRRQVGGRDPGGRLDPLERGRRREPVAQPAGQVVGERRVGLLLVLEHLGRDPPAGIGRGGRHRLAQERLVSLSLEPAQLLQGGRGPLPLAGRELDQPERHVARVGVEPLARLLGRLGAEEVEHERGQLGRLDRGQGRHQRGGVVLVRLLGDGLGGPLEVGDLGVGEERAQVRRGPQGELQAAQVVDHEVGAGEAEDHALRGVVVVDLPAVACRVVATVGPRLDQRQQLARRAEQGREVERARGLGVEVLREGGRVELRLHASRERLARGGLEVRQHEPAEPLEQLLLGAGRDQLHRQLGGVGRPEQRHDRREHVGGQAQPVGGQDRGLAAAGPLLDLEHLAGRARLDRLQLALLELGGEVGRPLLAVRL